jgi:fibronectin type 3 domain-containing protein
MIKTIALTIVALALVAIAGCGVGPPVTPSNLTVKATAPITLSWDSDLAATSYNIYRGTASGGLSTKTLVASNVSIGGEYPSTTYTDTLTTAGTTYYYQVTAVNWDKESAASNEVNATSQP